MRNLDRVDARTVQGGGNHCHLIQCVAMPNGVHAVAQGDVLNEEASVFMLALPPAGRVSPAPSLIRLAAQPTS